MRTGRRIVFVEPHRPLECWEGKVADPASGGLLIRTSIAGVCGTDVHRLDGDMPSRGYPVCLGHEGVGVIEELGAEVTADWAGTPIAIGDTIYWTPSSGLPAGRAAKQVWPPPADIPNVAAYQDYATLGPSNIFYRIPEDAPPEAVIAFGCAMPTALGGLTRLGGIQPSQVVIVQGCGPVGLASVFLAGLSPARAVIVIGDPDNRLSAAERLGATTVISLKKTTSGQRADVIASLTEGRGADVIVEAAGRKEAFLEGMELLAENGRYLMLGLYSGHGTVALNPFRLNNKSQTITGSYGAAQQSDYLTVIRFAKRFGERFDFPSLITHRVGLADTEAAIATMRCGDAIKAVVLPELDRSQA